VSEILEYHLHRGATPTLHFYRDRQGHEVDLLVDRGADRVAVEAKSGRTIAPDAFDALARFRTVGATRASLRDVVVYGGDVIQAVGWEARILETYFIFFLYCRAAQGSARPGSVLLHEPRGPVQAASSVSAKVIGTSTPSAKRAAITSSPFIASMNFLSVPT
jgi:hypothetical protein